jgi:hypothetical protein
MTIRVNHDELIAAAGGYDAIKAELDGNSVEILRTAIVDSGCAALDDAVMWFSANWAPGMTVVTDEQERLAAGLRATVTDFLGVDADVAYAHAVLERGLDLR